MLVGLYGGSGCTSVCLELPDAARVLRVSHEEMDGLKLTLRPEPENITQADKDLTESDALRRAAEAPQRPQKHASPQI